MIWCQFTGWPQHVPQCFPWSTWQKFSWTEMPCSSPWAGFSGARSRASLSVPDTSDSLPLTCLGPNPTTGLRSCSTLSQLSPAGREEQEAAMLTALPQSRKVVGMFESHRGRPRGEEELGFMSRLQGGRERGGQKMGSSLQKIQVLGESGRRGPCLPDRVTNQPGLPSTEKFPGTQGFPH